MAFLIIAVLSAPAPGAVLRIPVNTLVISEGNTRLEGKPDLLDLTREAKRLRAGYPESMSFDEINAVVDALTRFLRDGGYKFHRAYLGPQDPSSGTIKLGISATFLSDIVLQNNSSISDEVLRGFFEEYLDAPLFQPHIDEEILALKGTGGLNIFAYYSRGELANTVRLNVKVEDRPSKHFSFRADNYGNPDSGEYRGLINFSTRNSLQSFDYLSIGALYGDGAEVNIYGYLNYKLPIINLNHFLSFSATSNQFALGNDFESLEMEGDAAVVSLEYETILRRERRSSHSLSVGISDKQTDISTIFDSPLVEQDEHANSLDLHWQGSFISKSGLASHGAGLGWIYGRMEIDGVTTEKESFSKLTFDHSWQYRFGSADNRLQSRLASYIRGQYSSSQLPSFERMSLTGAYGVRALSPGVYGGDSGALVSMEWHFPALLGNYDNTIFSPFLFVDAAYARRLNFEKETESTADFSGAGLGIQISVKDKVYVKLIAAKAIDDELDDDYAVEESPLLVELYASW